MTPILSVIQKPVEADLLRFETLFSESFTGVPVPLKEVLSHVTSVKGKRLRPMLVFMTARLFGEPHDATMRTALFVEMIHTATLIHDDVVDASPERRGKPSVHVHWDVPTAVLSGDYLLAKAIRLLADPDNLPILQEMMDTAQAMSEGELMQRGVESGKWKVESEDQKYREIITRKTAMLFRSCCMGGAMSVGAPKESLVLISDFGLNLGMVFQMRDDILDDDDHETTKMAEALLPEYLEKTKAALEALRTVTADLSVDVLESLRTLALFCAERHH